MELGQSNTYIMMQRINLYILSNEHSRGSIYGIGTYLKELANALKDSTVNITVVYIHNEQVFKTEETDGIKSWYIPSTLENACYLDNESRAKQYYRNITKLMQLYMPDTNRLVFHLNFNEHQLLADTLKETFDCKIVSAIHYLNWGFALFGNVSQLRTILSTQDTNQENEFEKSMNEPFLKEKKLFETVDHVICLSEHTKQILNEDYQIASNKTSVIYNGLTDIPSVTDKQELRRKYHIPDIPILFFAGRLDEVKGLTYALQAFKTVINTQPCHFIIAGSGSFNIYMKACVDIWMHVTWTGLLDKEKLYDLYAIADIGVMPSLHEQCSYVSIEMMMHGVPLIASTSTGLCEMIEDGVTGLHIPVIEHPERVEIDSSLLAEKMLYLLQHPEERKRLGVNARKRYEQLFSSTVMRKNMLNFYNSLYDTENNSPSMGGA